MSFKHDAFWKRLASSHLLKPVELTRMRKASVAKRFSSENEIAAWLVQQLAITRFQGQVLALGSSGPFHYGEYTVQERMDGPGLGNLFTAVHKQSRHFVMLDFLAGDTIESEVTLARRIDGTVRHCEVQHPGLTDCFVLEQLPEHKFLVLESPPGMTLDERISEHGTVSRQTAIDWIDQLASGLQSLHAEGLCHGRVNPANIMIHEEQPRLYRNPLRHPLPIKSPATGHGPEWILPFEFAAPELSAWDRWPDASGDLYGLGCVLHFMVTGQSPFPGTAAGAIVRRHMNVAPPSISQFGPEVDAIMQRLLAKSSRTRTASVDDLRQSLQPLAPNKPIEVSPEVPEQFLYRIATRKSAIPAQVAAWQSDPEFTKLTAKNQVPVIDDGQVSDSRTEQWSFFDSKWSMPIVSAVVALLSVVIGQQLLQPTDSNGTELANGSAEQSVGGESGSLNTSENSNNKDPLGNGANSGTVSQPVPTVATTNSGQPPQNTNGVQATRFAVQNDDGALLWAPPTDGPPVDFQFAPEGGQFFLHVRPRRLLQHPEGQRVIEALGPAFASLRQNWEANHLPLEDVKSLFIAISADDESRPITVSDITLADGIKTPAKFSSSKIINTDVGPVFDCGQFACLQPSKFKQRRIVVGPVDVIKTIGAQNGATAVQRREFESLREFSDRDGDFALLLSPSYLLRDGRSLIAPAYAALPKSMDDFFGDGVNGLMFQAHLSDQSFFTELRLATTAEGQSNMRAAIPQKMANLSQFAEEYVANLDSLDVYWRQIALRFDNMLRFLSQQTRVGVENRHLVINAHLPTHAAHNLALATELALAAGISDGTGVASKPATTAKIDSMQAILQQRTSLNIIRQSLEFSMRDLAVDVNENVKGLPYPFVIKIVGADLQLDGITRNQQISDFKMDNATVAELLTGLVMRANPVTTVKTAAENDQKLIWVIQPSDDGKSDLILITTRKAAAAKQYSLPKVFVSGR